MSTEPKTADRIKFIHKSIERGTSLVLLREEIDTLYNESTSLHDSYGIAWAERFRAVILDMQGKIEDAAKLIAKAKRTANKNKIDDLRRECIFFENVQLLRNGDTRNAYAAFKSLLVDAHTADDKYNEANASLLLGVILKQNGFDDDAYDHFKRSLTIAQTSEYYEIRFNALMHLAESFLMKLQYASAAEYAHEAITISYLMANDLLRLRAEIRLVTILIEQDEIEKASELIKDIDKSRHLLTGPNMGTYHLCLGKLFVKKKQYNDARSEFQKAIDLFTSFQRERLIANTYGIIAEVFLEEHDLLKANESALFMLRKAEDINDDYHITQANRVLYQIAKEQGNAVNALAYLEQYNERIRRDEEQLLTGRIEFIKLQKEYEMKKNEAESEKKRRTLLQIELEHTERELTEKTKHLIKQTEALTQFRDDLRAIIRRSPADDPLVKQIKQRINDIPESQMNWEEFDKLFHSVHPMFLTRLSEKYPKLTPMERKICALLRLNMTSVDIAKLLFLSERNIENHRYRIRKKIALNSEKSLHEFLAQL